MSPQDFQQLSIHERLQLLKKFGNYIGARDHPAYFVYLYGYNGFFVEVYRLKTLNQIQWIEVQSNSDLLSEYVKIDGLY
jgi:hypothetical protein